MTTQDLLSVGEMSRLTRESPHRLVRALDALGIKPALRLDEVPYYPREASGKALLHLLDGEPEGAADA